MNFDIDSLSVLCSPEPVGEGGLRPVWHKVSVSAYVHTGTNTPPTKTLIAAFLAEVTRQLQDGLVVKADG